MAGPEDGMILRAGERVPTGHNWQTEEGQRALANLMLFGAQAGAAARNVQEVMRRHRLRSARDTVCQTCGEAWYWGEIGAESTGCSAYLLADAIEAVLWVASNRPAGTDKT